MQASGDYCKQTPKAVSQFDTRTETNNDITGDIKTQRKQIIQTILGKGK